MDRVLFAISMMVALTGILPVSAGGEATGKPAGDTSAKALPERFTNDDLAKSVLTKKGAVTNADLVGIEGNVTESEPGDETTYPSPWPRGRDLRENLAWLEANKRDYQTWRRRLDAIEAELPEASDRAEREIGRRYLLVNGILVGVPGLPGDQPAHEYLRALEEEKREVQEKVHDVELEARRHGFGSAALVKASEFRSKLPDRGRSCRD